MSSDEHRRSVGRLAELGLLTATLNHELRQPLFAIKSLIQLIQARPDAPSELAEVLQQIELMEGLVDGVSHFSRHTPQTLAPIDVHHSVQQAVRLLRHRASRRRVGVRVERVVGIPAARGEATALMQVMVNLIQNAIDASPVDGEVTVRMDSGEGAIWIDVSDMGGGIPLELREKIFEPFFTTKAPGVGTGLGLSIARELVQACGGRLIVLEVSRGACVRVELSPWV